MSDKIWFSVHFQTNEHKGDTSFPARSIEDARAIFCRDHPMLAHADLTIRTHAGVRNKSDKGDLIIAREELNRRIDRLDMRVAAVEGMFATTERRLQNVEAVSVERMKRIAELERRLRNIEAQRAHALAEQKARASSPSQFVPAPMVGLIKDSAG